MKNYLEGKSIVVTGAGGGFGKLTSEKAAALGARVVCAGRREENIRAVAEGIRANGFEAAYVKADVAVKADMDAMAQFAVKQYGRIDVLVNNAGVMPLAFFSDHKTAWQAWDRCIDINLKGVVYGISAVYDQMIEQGQGHIINVSSIYGNKPVVGGSVYQATKIAERYIAETLRQEARGKIKVSIISPTGVPDTGLSGSIINRQSGIGIMGQNMKEAVDYMTDMQNRPELKDREKIGYYFLDPEAIVDSIIYMINQPWGVNISDMTVRSSGEPFVI